MPAFRLPGTQFTLSEIPTKGGAGMLHVPGKSIPQGDCLLGGRILSVWERTNPHKSQAG